MVFAPQFPSGLRAVFLMECCDLMGTVLWVLSVPNPVCMGDPHAHHAQTALLYPTPLHVHCLVKPHFLHALFTRKSIPASAAECISGKE